MYDFSIGVIVDSFRLPIPEAVKKERVSRLLALNDIQREAFLASGRGRKAEVLFTAAVTEDQYHTTGISSCLLLPLPKILKLAELYCCSNSAD